MRKQYWDILSQKLREGGFSWIAGAGTSVVGTWLSNRVGRPLVGPSIGTLIITYRCNYFCEFCELPARAVRRKKQGITEFTPEEMIEVVRGFKTLRTAGIGITGGEPMIRKDIYDVLSEITRLKMVGHINTNGHFLNEEKVKRLISTGVASINISLDAPDAETHNRIRGNRRSYEQIMKAVENIRRLRKNGKPRVGLTTVLLGENVEKALDMSKLAHEIGVDSLGFIPIHEYHDGSDLGEILKRREFAEKSRTTIEQLKSESDGILENSDRYLSLFPRCFSGKPSGLKCYAPWNSMVIDCYGRVFPCVPLSEIDDPLDSISADGVVDCWRGPVYQKKREDLAQCQACYWNCHTESNLLFQRAPRETG